MTRRTKSGHAEPENFVQLSDKDAEKFAVLDAEQVWVHTRRGQLTVKAEISNMAEGVIWMPFYYAEALTNLLTSGALDPVCGITKLKVCGCRDRK